MTENNAIKKNRKTYAMQHWTEGYFDINAKGHVEVYPSGSKEKAVDLYELATTLTSQGLSLPILVRFIDILKHRVNNLQHAFEHAAKQHNYKGGYTPVYPIKVNQQKFVIDGILAAGGVGLEAGSKAELLAILGLPAAKIIICNGYKDRAYIRYALMAMKLGCKITIVIEKPSELDILISETEKLKIKPNIGIRIRLSSISAGKWQNSGGEKSKFGMHPGQILQIIKRLKQNNLLPFLHLMHFHMGSQVANINDIKIALQESGRLFEELIALGAPIDCLDVGGGLAIDYDGSQSRGECSMNYSVEEYASNVIAEFAKLCQQKSIRHPHIISESGRALTAHHAILITDIIDTEKTAVAEQQIPLKNNIEESYHDALFELDKAQAKFLQGSINLSELAVAENKHTATCKQIRNNLDLNKQTHSHITEELDEKLADKVFCNFSIFSSLPDVWGIEQIFPIMPIHNLCNIPETRAVIHDLTCDSDGRIDNYVDESNTKKTIALHAWDETQPYLLGFFLLGAYQEILGDKHNLFGATDSVNIELDSNGFHLAEPVKGEIINDLLQYVHINPDAIKAAYKDKITQAGLSKEMQHLFEQELYEGLLTYSYLNK